METRHVAFWQEFFKLDLPRLDWGRRLKLWLMVGVARLFGAPAIHLILEAIEVFERYCTVCQSVRPAFPVDVRVDYRVSTEAPTKAAA